MNQLAILLLFISCYSYTMETNFQSNQSTGHIAFIIDGNRRWARQHGLAPWEGHSAGADRLFNIINECLQQRINHVSFFIFSLENFKRSEEEKSHLFDIILQKFCYKARDYYLTNGICVRFIGDRDNFPVHMREPIAEIENTTKDLHVLYLNYIFCYGAQQEIIAGVKNISQLILNNKLQPEEITTRKFEESLWTHYSPPPDLIIRTGGSKRLSNFFLYQAAYTEFFFIDKFWPDFTSLDLQEIFKEFRNRKRNFGI